MISFYIFLDFWNPLGSPYYQKEENENFTYGVRDIKIGEKGVWKNFWKIFKVEAFGISEPRQILRPFSGLASSKLQILMVAYVHIKYSTEQFWVESNHPHPPPPSLRYRKKRGPGRDNNLLFPRGKPTGKQGTGCLYELSITKGRLSYSCSCNPGFYRIHKDHTMLN